MLARDRVVLTHLQLFRLGTRIFLGDMVKPVLAVLTNLIKTVAGFAITVVHPLMRHAAGSIIIAHRLSRLSRRGFQTGCRSSGLASAMAAAVLRRILA